MTAEGPNEEPAAAIVEHSAAEPAEVLDCRGMRCPQPVIALARRLPALPVGAVILVLADDPAAALDIPAWCRLRDQEYLGATDGPGFLVRRRR